LQKELLASFPVQRGEPPQGSKILLFLKKRKKKDFFVSALAIAAARVP
jgi:hypothetical protein